MSSTVIGVNNIQQLYKEVNDPGNANKTILLASGTYTLDATNPLGTANAGRLVLQPGMSLMGQNEYVDMDHDGIWDPRDDNNDGIPDTNATGDLVFALPSTETIIDAGLLKDPVNGKKQGAIRIGLANRVEKLTIRNSQGVAAAIDVNVMPSSGGMRAEIRDNILEYGQRGIRMQHAKLNGVNSSAVLERNIARHNDVSTKIGFGVQIVNGSSTDCSWDVTVLYNRFYANRYGLFVAGNASTHVTARVRSVRNMYRENQTGMTFFTGLDGYSPADIPPNPQGGNRNNIQLISVDDEIAENKEIDNFDGFGGGVVAISGYRTDSNADPSSDNSASLEFIGTKWIDNFQQGDRRDLLVYGAVAISGAPGTNDRVCVLIRHATSDGTAEAFELIDSQPPDSTKSDRVTLDLVLTNASVGFGPHP
jgi:hypothetical protein